MNSLLTLAALLGVAGCADRGPPPGVFDGIDAQIGHMDAQEGAHLQAIRSAASLPAVLTEAAAHRDHISGEFESIRAGIDTLAKCTVRTSVNLDTSGLHAALQDVIAEEDRHSNELRTAPDVPTAIALGERHNDAMTRQTGLVAYLRSQRDDLANRAATAECP